MPARRAAEDTSLQYVYMDNFRGFTDTLVPLHDVSFLVGENSTGKSSFLKLIELLSRQQFFIAPAEELQRETDLGQYANIVSASSTDKSYFRVGWVQTSTATTDRRRAEFTIITFTSRDGMPVATGCIHYRSGLGIALSYKTKWVHHCILEGPEELADEEEALDLFGRVGRPAVPSDPGWSAWRTSPPIRRELPPYMALAMASGWRLGRARGGSRVSYSFAHPRYNRSVTRLAPIRTRPQRFYSGAPGDFNPEGMHVPHMLRNTLKGRSSRRFTEKLATFGQASGLFEAIVAHTFGPAFHGPFELLVKFADIRVNIGDVGYGVSQVLPLIVEFLGGSRDGLYAVEQPEVHLHPRAQAALGDLIFGLSKERGHHFVLETHSDYIIDRFRLAMRRDTDGDGDPLNAQVLFFQRMDGRNVLTQIPISADGQYGREQPKEFREFFIREATDLLEL